MLLNKLSLVLIAVLTTSAIAFADADNSLTIYNQNFAVIRQPIALSLVDEPNHVTVTDVTAQVEPDSVVLRDPSGIHALRIYEQNYLADPISAARLLDQAVGKTIEFVQPDGKVVEGKVIRSGYVSPYTPYYDPSGQYNQYQYQQQQNQGPLEPLIEVNGKLQFSLPGEPRFDSLSAGAILKPTLDWTLTTDKPGAFVAELSYVTAGMTWDASYNLVAPEGGGPLEMTAWVTMKNASGRTFDNAKIKLMAGDVNKITQPGGPYGYGQLADVEARNGGQPATTEKTFDDYHLYSIERPTTLRDGETKQVEFAHAAAVKSTTTYIYDGVKIDQNQYNGWAYENIRGQREYGTQDNTKVWIERDFKNDAANGLGIALPKGTTRFYQRDSDGHLEFLGEDSIDHTPSGETVRLRTGNAFDIVGERTQTAYDIQDQGNGNSEADETFKIVLRNHKATPVEVKIVEHLYRGDNWAITAKSDAFVKTDAQTIEFLVTVPADDSKTITYTAHYTW